MKSVNFGIVGTNFITDWMLAGAAHEPRFNLSAVYSRSADTAKAFANKHNVDTTYTDLDEMAASDRIDAVYIASPNSFHALQALKFLDKGKHVLVEKPFAGNTTEAKAVIAMAEKRGLVVMEAMKTTATPNFIKVKTSLPLLGKIRRYFASYCQYSSRYDKFKEGVVLNAFNPDLGNGALTDIGVYCISPMVALFGKPSEIKAVSYRLNSGADGQGAVLCSYPEMEAVLQYSKISDSALPSEIQGEDAVIRINKINKFDNIGLFYRNGKQEDINVSHIEDDMYYEIKLFIDRVLGEDTCPYLNTVEQSLCVMEIIDEIRNQTGIVYNSTLHTLL